MHRRLMETKPLVPRDSIVGILNAKYRDYFLFHALSTATTPLSSCISDAPAGCRMLWRSQIVRVLIFRAGGEFSETPR